MDRKGIVIWILGLIVLGLLAAYLFNQSQKNQTELNKQASRNVLMMREALHKSAEDLKTEIRGFIKYKEAYFLEGRTKKSAAAKAQNRDLKKFQFYSDKQNRQEFEFKEYVEVRIASIDSLSKFSNKEKVFEGINFTTSTNPIQAYTKASYSSWLREMERSNTFFDEVVLAQDDGGILHPEYLRGTKINGEAKTLTARFANQNVGQFEMNLNASPHRGYATSLKEGAAVIWVIGLKNEEDLTAAAYRIDYTVFTLIALGLLFLLASTPIISFFSMDKGDILSQRRIHGIAFSLLLVFGVGGWTFGYLFYKPFDTRVEKDLSVEIKTELGKNLDTLIYQLSQDEWKKLKSLEINERLGSNSKGDLHTMLFEKNTKADTALDFSYITIDHRNYFRHFVSKETLIQEKEYWKFDSKKQDSLFIERIFSQKSGDPEIVISQLRDSSLHAISFKMDSTLLTQDRRYLLVKKNGEVVFGSKQFEIPFTGLHEVLPDEKWEMFEEIVRQKADTTLQWEIPIHLNGQEYTALMSPLKVKDKSEVLWFIYLVNKNSYHLKAGLISLGSFSFLLIYLLSIGILMAIPHWLTEQKYNWKIFSFHWILPKEFRFGNFKKAFVILGISISLVSLLIFVGWPWEKLPFLCSLVVIPLLSLMLTMVVYRVLKSKRTRLADKNWYYAFIFSFFLMITFLPGFLIFKQVNSLENQLWGRSIEQNKSVANHSVNWLLGFRTGFFNRMSVPYDGQMVRYFIPEPSDFERVLEGKKFSEWISVSSGYWKFWTGFGTLLLLSGSYLGLKLLLRRLFWLDFQMEEENALREIMENELQGVSNLRIFLCGCDSMVNRFWVYSTFRLEAKDVYLVDCANEGLRLPKAYELDGKKVLLIEDIHCLGDLSELMRTISKLEGLTQKIHLILSAGASWRTLVSKMNSELDKVRFSELMSGFYFEFVPIIPENKTGEIHPDNYFSESEVEDYFKKRKIIGLETEKPYARLLLQRYGKAYFYNIWAELSIEEKHVCYAYAMEGFINPENYEEVVELYQKGVFVDNWRGKSLRLFSKTFRYFIISNISTATKKMIHAYRKKNSTANNIQWAVLSFLILAIGLLAYFERSFFTEIQAMVTGVLGFVGFLLGQAKKFFQMKGLEG